MIIKDKKFNGVIFDIDGTLLESTSIWHDVDVEFFKKRGMELPDDYAQAIGHIGLDKAAIYTIERFHLNEKKEDIIKEWKDGVLDHYRYKVKAKPHVKEFLMFLKENNIPFCAATANDEDCYRSSLENNGIYHLFDFILEVNNFPYGKDRPDIYIHACKQLNVNPANTLVFEDLLMPIRTINKAGFISVGVYDENTIEIDEVKKESYIYIRDYQELFNYIKKD